MAEHKGMGTDQGKGVDQRDSLGMELFLKVFGGEVLTAFTHQVKTMDRHMVRTISHGSSCSFPIIGNSSSSYLKPGENIDDRISTIKHSERVISIDGLCFDSVVIHDIEAAMNHFDVRSEYATQMGNALAVSADGAVLAEMAKLCNPVSSDKDENIEGLGSASVIDIGITKGEEQNQAELGLAIIESLGEARTKLTENRVPISERYFYTTPHCYSAILSSMLPGAANFAAFTDPETGHIRNIMGFEVIEVPHLIQGGAFEEKRSDDKKKKHEFPTDGIGGVVKVNESNVIGLFNHRTAVGTVKLRDLAMERGRRINLQGDMIVAKYAMGHGGLRPESAGALVRKTT